MNPAPPLRILLLSGYDATSHRYWYRGLMESFPYYRWTLLKLSPRHFNWRIRGNPLSWLSENQGQLSAPYDLVIATSTVDVATLKGLVPSLAATPWLCYFHENQFEYPRSAHQHHSIEAQMVNLYAALAADRVLFNSAFNRDSFMAGAERLMRRLPDHRPRHFEALLGHKVAVLPVPLDDSLRRVPRRVPRREARQFTLCWNHRWEYDKAPERLLATLRGLARRQVPFRLHLLGERFRSVPAALDQIQSEFAHCLGQVGYVESRDEYYRLLAESHLVISNSVHEFQGVAVMEAVALGALPRVPDRLSYPELFPADCCYPSLNDGEAEAEGLAARLADDYRGFESASLAPSPSMEGCYWSALKPAYRAEFERLVQGDRSGAVCY